MKQKQTSKFDYLVEQVPLHLPNGDVTKCFANVRTDTNQVLGVVSEKYTILQNTNLFDSVEKLFPEKGFGSYTRNTVVTKDGARARAIYDFKDHGIKLKNGNDLLLRLKVQNSFDRSLRASFQVGLVRLVCSNGLALPIADVGMTRKHTSNLEPELIERAFANSVEAFSEAAPFFNSMIDYRISMNEGSNILKNLEKRGVLRERMREAVENVWLSPKYEEDSDRNVFNVYNAITQHLTHIEEPRQFEVSENVNSAVLKTFSRYIKKNNFTELTEVGIYN